MTTKIYSLQDENGCIRYIGKTAGNLEKRFSQHFREARRGIKNYRCNWIRSVLSRGKLPSIFLIGEIEGNGNSEEIAWIKYFRDEEVCLVNGTDGGSKPTDLWSIESRVKMSNTTKGMARPWLRGKPLSAKTRRKLSESHKGKKFSIERRRNMSGRQHSVETLRKMSEAHKNVSVETRRKLSQAGLGHKGYWLGKKHPFKRRQKITGVK